MLPALRTALKSDPFAVVENLGTNDAIQARAGYDWKKSWDELISTTRNVPCVILLRLAPAPWKAKEAVFPYFDRPIFA